jgi:hypothetical protein
MLQTRTAEAGRVWMVCRYLDEEGRGWVYIEDLKRYLTRSESSLQLVAAKEFETILREGDGLFWNLDNQGRLWLAGLARVASSLNIERVWKAQRLPIKQIIQGLSQYRLHSFAASYLNRPSKPFRVNE